MKRAFTTLFALATASFAMAAQADSHVAQGEELVAKRCKACHTIANGDDVILKGGKVGPNLWGVVGRSAGAEDGFKYGDDLAKAGEKGLVWDAAQIAAYVADPKEFLKAYLDDKKAKSKMTFKLKDEDQRAAVAAYLASLGE